jgi:hypothetical protein
MKYKEQVKDIARKNIDMDDAAIESRVLLTQLCDDLKKGERTMTWTPGTVRRWIHEARLEKAGNDDAGLPALRSLMRVRKFPFPEETSWLRVLPIFETLFFMTDQGQDALRRHKDWLIDGTFRSAPGQYVQVLNVMVATSYGNATCCHIFMVAQDEETYLQAFSRFLEMVFPDDPQPEVRVIFDFEQAEINGFRRAWEKRFGNTVGLSINGCLFHYAQAVYRWYQKNVPSRLKKSDNMKRLLSFFLWLPHFARETVQMLMTELDQRDTKCDACKDFIAYFNRYWMQEDRFNMWSGQMEKRTYTTCALENFHGQLNQKIQKKAPGRRPTIIELSDVLLGMDMGALFTLNQNIRTGRETDQQFSTRTAVGLEFPGEVVARLVSFVQGFAVGMHEPHSSLSPAQIMEDMWDGTRASQSEIDKARVCCFRDDLTPLKGRKRKQPPH